MDQLGHQTDHSVRKWHGNKKEHFFRLMTHQIACNICGSTEFGQKGKRPNVRCLSCDSLERTRLLWMYLQRMDLGPETRILYLAPDRCIYESLAKWIGAECITTADIDVARYARFAPETAAIDLCSLNDWPTDAYDLIIHCHVLEHIPCNIAYSLHHLHRMLKPEGRHVFIVPFRKGKWEESFRDLTEDERTRLYGQFDHIRSFGKEDAAEHLGRLIPLDYNFDAIADFGEEKIARANVPLTDARGLTTATVINVGKNDLFT